MFCIDLFFMILAILLQA